MVAGTKRSLELTTLYEISKLLTSTFNLDQSLTSVMNVLDKFLGMRYGTIVLQDKETKSLNTVVSLGVEKKRHIKFRSGEGIIGKVFKTGSPIVVTDIRDEPSIWKGMKLEDSILTKFSLLCIPIKSQMGTIGTLSVIYCRSEESVSINEALSLLTMIGSLIGQAVEISRKVNEEKARLREEKMHLQQELASLHRIDNMIGRSDIMQETFETIRRVALSSATVLIRGESGTGKELVARAIHYNSPRAEGPFIKINCTAIPDTLLETELFGHVKGSFTGASGERKGRFELADKGTIFLDEIGDLPVSTQLKLLRVLQERSFEKVGSSATISVDVRIVAATNSDLEAAIGRGTFREDLFYRLNVVPIILPPVRSRREDIPLLIEYFLKKFNKENSKNVGISADAMEYLLGYAWPGNVREIENCIERVVILSDNDIATRNDLPYEILNARRIPPLSRPEDVHKPEDDSLTKTVEDIEIERIVDALKKCGWVKSRAARLIGLTTRQLDYRISKYGISFDKPWRDS
jgi:Nif-specific regulatory protein